MEHESIKLICKTVCFASCIIGACYLMLVGKDGWGWLLILAMFL